MLYSIIVSLLLGLLAVFPPYLGFLYTGKIIKEFKDRWIKKGLIVFFLSGNKKCFCGHIYDFEDNTKCPKCRKPNDNKKV